VTIPESSSGPISFSRATDTDATSWVWAPRLDPNCNDYGLFVNSNNEIRIDHGASNIAISGIRVILNNYFAPMPVCGHGYASAQFIGRGSTEVSLQLSGINDIRIAYIQAMHEELEKNARFFRSFTGAARVRFSGNELLQLAGIHDGIVSSIDTETDPNGTDLYRCQISFTSDGHHTEGFSQEMYVDSAVAGRVLSGLLARINVTVLNATATRALNSDAGVAAQIRHNFAETGGDIAEVAVDAVGLGGGVIADAARAVGEAAGDLVGFNASVINQVGRDAAQELGFQDAGNIASVDGILGAAGALADSSLRMAGDYISGEDVAANARRGSYLTNPIRVQAPDGGKDSAVYAPVRDPNHRWLDRWLDDVVRVLTESQIDLPPQTFFRGERRGRYLNLSSGGSILNAETDQVTPLDPTTGTVSRWPPMLGDSNSTLCGMIHGQRLAWEGNLPDRATGMSPLERSLFIFEDALMSIAQNVLSTSQAEPGFGELFTGVTRDWVNSERVTAHPTFPDLDLPAHPVTGLAIDTEPDYYFFNDSEEGLMNEIGPNIIREIDIRLENMENTFGRLASDQEWSETYLGRSRFAVDLETYNETTQGSLNPNDPYGGMDVGPDVEIDPDNISGTANWGAPEGRAVGISRSASVDSQAVSDVALSLSQIARGSSSPNSQELMRQRLAMMRNTVYSIPTGDGTTTGTNIRIGAIDEALGKGDRSHSFSRNAIRTIVEQSIAQSPETSLTMRRAFPSFKIYFIEDDTGAMRDHLLPSGGASGGVRPIMYFDDLYNYNSVKSIRLIRSRKNPADLLVLELTNVQGLLERRSWAPLEERDREIYAPGFEETEMENPLKKIIMKEGLKVQARLGYCVDEETEILTQRGWLKRQDVLVGDITLTLNHQTGFSEWQPIEKINNFNFNGSLISMEGTCHSSLTTSNHRWPIMRQTTKNNIPTLVREWTTSENLNTSHRIITGAGCNDIKESTFSDAFVEVVAWTWTEGHLTNTKNKDRKPGLVISQSSTANPGKVISISNALTAVFGSVSSSLGNGGTGAFGTTPRWIQKQRSNRDEVEFRLNSVAAAEILKVANDKIVSREFILQLTPSQLDLFIKISNQADGNYSQSDNGPLLFVQKNPRSLDALELAAILAGHRTHRYYSKKVIIGRHGIQYNPNVLYISRNTNVYINKKNLYPKKQSYNGVVWCPTTQNGSWLARRNGITHFTGNSNNPLKMGIKFIGEVVEFSYSAECSDQVTIICQSYGAELTLEPKGVLPDSRTRFFDTPDLLHTIMCSPELVHFGRFELNPQFNPAEARSQATSRAEAGVRGRLIQNPRETISDLQNLLITNRSKWILANNASDDNIFAPGIRDHLSEWERFLDDAGANLMWGSDWVRAAGENISLWAIGAMALLNPWQALNTWNMRQGLISGADAMNAGGTLLSTAQFTLSGQTIWEIIKECELRHPGWIGHPRPYGTRMTMFFGIPSHSYWSDQITRAEMLVLQRLRQANLDAMRRSALGVTMNLVRSVSHFDSNRAANTANIAGVDLGSLAEVSALGFDAYYIFLRTSLELASNQFLSGAAGLHIAQTLGRFKPFRRYHLITSEHHILMNNIRASNKGVFNAVNLQYGDGSVYTIKADDSIPDELTRVESFSYPSCENETMARRYCIGLLNRHLKDVYKGELVVTGMDIDVYDTCYLHDERTSMFGTFEVEQVVDTFSAETGWITEITPDLITGTNEWSTRSTSEARNAAIGAISERYMGARLSSSSVGGMTVAGLATGALVTGALTGPVATAVGVAAASLAWMGGYYIVRWTQNRQPIWVCPLIVGERPFFSGLDGFRQDGLFASIRGELCAEFDAVREGWRQFHLDGFANNISLGVARAIAGQGGGA